MEKSWYSTDRVNRVVLFALLVLVIGSSTVFSDEYRPWTGEYLRVGAGARAMGMGNAYAAVEGDIFSYYYNPAGLSSMEERQMAISFRYLSMDRYFKDIVLGSKIGPGASFALSWINAGTHEIIGRDLNGKPTGTLSDTRNTFGITFSKNLNRMLSIGFNAKVSTWKLDKDDAKAYGIDLGVLARPLTNLTASFVVRDLNSRFTWNSSRWKERLGSFDGQSIEKEDKFPLFYTVGAAYKTYRDKVLLAATLEFVEDNPMGIDLGASYRLNRIFTVRTGIYNYTSSDELESGSLTAGFTLRVTSSISFDYAYLTGSIDNDSIHCISLVMNNAVD
ncbi:PorV/PorQ family protein [Candidatus Omnitrophota bacterium]